MPALKKAVPGKKKVIIKDWDQLKKVFERVFSERFYDKVGYRALRYFKINPEQIVRVNQYTSPDNGHSFIAVLFKNKKMIGQTEINTFNKAIKQDLKNSGYFGTVEKINRMFNKKRHAVEIPLIWKAKSVGGCYCMLFERFA